MNNLSSLWIPVMGATKQRLLHSQAKVEHFLNSVQQSRELPETMNEFSSYKSIKDFS